MIYRAPGYWRRLERQRTSPFAGFSDMLARYDLAFPTSMPDLRSAMTLLAATDASGEHDRASYLTYGLLLLDYDLIGDWLDMAGEFRQEYISNRRMSFKSLRDRQRLCALGPFLELTTAMKGFLIVVAVHRDVASLFDAPFPEADTPWIRALRSWPSHILEHAGFFSHLLTLDLAFKLFLKMHHNWCHGKESFVSSHQLAGVPPVASLGTVPEGMEAKGYRRGLECYQRVHQPVGEAS